MEIIRDVPERVLQRIQSLQRPPSVNAGIPDDRVWTWYHLFNDHGGAAISYHSQCMDVFHVHFRTRHNCKGHFWFAPPLVPLEMKHILKNIDKFAIEDIFIPTGTLYKSDSQIHIPPCITPRISCIESILPWVSFLTSQESPFIKMFPYLYTRDPEFISQYGLLFPDITNTPILPIKSFCQLLRVPFKNPEKYIQWLYYTKVLGVEPRAAVLLTIGFRFHPERNSYTLSCGDTFMTGFISNYVYRWLSQKMRVNYGVDGMEVAPHDGYRTSNMFSNKNMETESIINTKAKLPSQFSLKGALDWFQELYKKGEQEEKEQEDKKCVA